MFSKRKDPKEVKKKLIAVGTKIPSNIVEKIEKEIIPREFVSMSDYLRHLIREDLKKRGISTSL
jgi:Arc/MetJ-type ribon-helix-helix transcriptional regulator